MVSLVFVREDMCSDGMSTVAVCAWSSFEMDVDRRKRESEVLTSLGKTYSHNLEVVERLGEIGIKCRILCAQTRRRGAS
jgi:hypothetical protein